MPTNTRSGSHTDDESSLPVLRIRGSADLVTAIPYLLGFRPARSLVLVGMADRRVVVTARMDLADVAVPRMVEHSVAGLQRGGARQFVVVVFDDEAMVDRRTTAGGGGDTGAQQRSDRTVLPWADQVVAVSEAVADQGGVVDDVVLVSGQRLWSYLCDEPDCCSPAGRELAADSIVAAEATYAGLVALPDRESLSALLEPDASADRAGLADLLMDAERAAVEAIMRGQIGRADRAAIRALFAACRASDRLGASPQLSDAQLVRFGISLMRIEVRDSLWLGIDRDRIDGRTLWCYLARHLPAPYNAAPMFLFGWSSFRHGDGALAGIAAERALVIDPAYSAADLLLAALSQAVGPAQLPRLRGRRAS